MSVPKSKRSEPKCQAVLEAKRLALYTYQIASNENIFNVAFKSLTEAITSSAQRIYTDCMCANNVYVDNTDKFYIRTDYQRDAIRETKNLLALIDLAFTQFHLKWTRVQYWSELVIKVQTLIRAWNKSDSERYKKYK